MHANRRPTTIIHGNQLLKLTDRELLIKFRCDWLYGHSNQNTKALTDEMQRRGYSCDYRDVTDRLK